MSIPIDVRLPVSLRVRTAAGDVVPGADVTAGCTLDESTASESCDCLLQVPAQTASLTLVEKLTESICGEIPLDSSRTDAIVLSVSEVLCNVLRHGGVCETGAVVLVRYYRDESELRVCLSDSGNRLPDPVAERYRQHVVAMPATSESAEDLPEGGWGINLVLQGTSAVIYRRVAEWNHLTLCFSLKP